MFHIIDESQYVHAFLVLWFEVLFKVIVKFFVASADDGEFHVRIDKYLPGILLEADTSFAASRKQDVKRLGKEDLN